MLSTVSSISFELNSSYYATVGGNNSLNLSEFRNATNLYMLPAYIRITSMSVCIVVMLLGIIGNLMVPLVVYRARDMRNSTNIFLVNLSIADLLVLLICTPTVLVEVDSGPEIWPLGEFLCKLVPFVELTVAHASVLTILAISFERYYAICEPLRVGYVCTKARATILCFIAWFAAALCTSPIILVSQYQEVRVKDSKNSDTRNFVPVCLTVADTSATMVFFLLLLLLFYLAPLLILLILYAFIIKQLVPDPSNTSDSYYARAKKHVITMLLSVVISFFLCLSPYRIMIFYILIAPAEQIAKIDRDTFFVFLNFSRIMFYLHSAIDPILYNLMSSKFRRGFLELCKLKKCESRELRSRTSGTKRTESSEQEENFV